LTCSTTLATSLSTTPSTSTSMTTSNLFFWYLNLKKFKWIFGGCKCPGGNCLKKRQIALGPSIVYFNAKPPISWIRRKLR
jgi:hypothetical protein